MTGQSEFLTPALPDRYRLDRLLGESGDARVWAATDTATGDEVAVKTPRFADYHTGLPRRLESEYRITSAFGHPNILRVVDVDASGERYTPYLVAELVDGPTFQAHRDTRGAVSVDRVAAMGLDITAALGAMHRAGWVHRDVKSENVMLTGDGRVKLIDLGAAGRVGDAGAEFVFGADGYVAPEIERAYRARLNRRRDVELPLPDPAMDVYGAGVLLYEAATGKHTRETLARTLSRRGPGLPPLGEIVDNVPDTLGRLVTAMTAESPADRPTIDEAHAELREIAANAPDRSTAAPVARNRGRAQSPHPTTRARPSAREVGVLVDRAVLRTAATGFQAPAVQVRGAAPHRGSPTPVNTSGPAVLDAVPMVSPDKADHGLRLSRDKAP